MSSLCISHLSKPPLLRLPPTLRVQVYRQSLHQRSPALTRQFHASTPQQSTLHHLATMHLEDMPHEILLALHSLNLPWSTVIPLSAILVRLGITLFLSYPAHTALQRRRDLMPMLTGIQRAIKHSNYFRGWSPDQVNLFVRQNRDTMVRKWRAERWRGLLPWLQFPVFIGFVETIRAMGGSAVGFFGALKQRLFPGGLELHGEEVSPNLIERSEWFEPTFRTEGLSWFPDLTVPDPTGVLPLLAPSLFAANILISSGLVTDPKAVLKTRLSRMLLAASGALTLGLYVSAPLLPAGLLYYWVWSSGCALVANGWLNWRYPVRKIAATKREVPRPKGRQV